MLGVAIVGGVVVALCAVAIGPGVSLIATVRGGVSCAHFYRSLTLTHTLTLTLNHSLTFDVNYSQKLQIEFRLTHARIATSWRFMRVRCTGTVHQISNSHFNLFDLQY